jgi:hypothetical protein
MYTNVSLEAPFGVLLFLGAGLVAGVMCLLIIYSLLKKNYKLTRIALIGIVVCAGAYLGLTLLFSVRSADRVLARGQEKHFCEIDCHLAYSITDVREAKTLGDAANQVTANGTFRVVSIKTRFDENTISKTRGNAPLQPNSRVLSVLGEDGHIYYPAIAGQTALERSQAAGTPISTPLRPAETYTTTVVFDLPPNVRNPTLLIRQGDFVTRFLIGHENSLMHKKIRFQI